MSLLEEAELRTWYVGFRESEYWHNHCYCFAPMGEVTQVIEPKVTGADVGVCVGYASELAQKEIEKGNRVIKVVCKPENIAWKSVWYPSCVSMVKAIVGINTPAYVVTPEMLYRFLLRSEYGVVI